MIGDLRGRLDQAQLHVQQLEQDKRHLTAQLVEALKPLPQQAVTDQIVADMLLDDVIVSAIKRTAGNDTAMSNYLDGFARTELSKGTEPAEIAEMILRGDEDIPISPVIDDLGFIPPE